MSGLTDFVSVMEPTAIKLVTPTQQAALILENKSINSSKAFLKICSTLPINLKKIDRHAKEIKHKFEMNFLKRN